MLKALIKKQLLSLVSGVIINTKTGKKRSKGQLILYALLFLYAFGAMAAMFLSMGMLLSDLLDQIGFAWLYFALAGSAAVAIGIVTSIFTTYSGLYKAKDNDLLLSMPIPDKTILFSRLLGCYTMCFVFEAIVLLPIMIAFIIECGMSAFGIIACVLSIVLCPMLTLAVSCLLGWLVAVISSRITVGKNLITVILALAAMALYMIYYPKLIENITVVAEKSNEISRVVRTALYPLYQMGLACTGDVKAFLLFALICVGAIAVVFFFLSASFRNIATRQTGVRKVKFEQGAIKTSSMRKALFMKELCRFKSSTVYMLNCGLGSVFMLAGSVAILLKKAEISQALMAFGGGEGAKYIALIVCAISCLVASMNDITAPSISLEGKALWILKSMPVNVKDIYLSKILLHLVITIPPAMIMTVVFSAVMEIGLLPAVLCVICAAAFVVFTAEFGLMLNVKMPNLNWTNETAAVKQSVNVLIAMFGGMAVIISLAIVFVLIRKFTDPILWLAVCTALIIAADALIWKWFTTKGTEEFLEL